MLHLKDLLDVDKVNEYVRQGYITRRPHPRLDLDIYNYTPKTTYENLWDHETMTCRGLVVNSKGHIVARPLPKIKSIHEYEDQSFITSWELKRVQEKKDGSLGILVFYNDEAFITTRGSFESDQAREATKILNNKYQYFVDHKVRKLPQTFDYRCALPITFCFEIVYPQNRIVVDYGQAKDLYLICGISIESGMSFFPEQLHEWMGPDVDAFSLDGNYEAPGLINHALDKIAEDEENTEGLVLTFVKPVTAETKFSPEHFRVKMKTAKYIEMSRIMTRLTKKAVWESLSAGTPLSETAKILEGDVFDWIHEQEQLLFKEFKQIDKDAYDEFCVIRDKLADTNPTRKEWADLILKTPYSHLLFCMVDEKDYSKLIWKMLEPMGEGNIIYGSYPSTENTAEDQE